MTIRDALGEVLSELEADWSPEHRELGVQVLEDLVKLQARAAIGAEVRGELVHARAAAQSLIAGGASSVAEALEVTLTRWAGRLVAAVL